MKLREELELFSKYLVIICLFTNPILLSKREFDNKVDLLQGNFVKKKVKVNPLIDIFFKPLKISFSVDLLKKIEENSIKNCSHKFLLYFFLKF